MSNTDLTIERAYLAGPMRNKPEYNYNTFEAASVWLQSMGWEVVSPHIIDLDEGLFTADIIRDPEREWQATYKNVQPTDSFTFEKAISRDIEAVLGCTAVAMLPGWHLSVGAKIEDQVRQWLRMPRYLLDNRYGVWSYRVDHEAKMGA